MVRLLLLVGSLFSPVAQAQEPVRTDNLCWTPIRDAETYFNILKGCLTYQRGDELIRDWEAMLRRQGFQPDPATSNSRWLKSDQTGKLTVNAVFGGNGVRADLAFSPNAPILVAPAILEMLTKRADYIPEYSAMSVRLLHKVNRGYENCDEEEGHRVSIDGRLVEALWNLWCRVK